MGNTRLGRVPSQAMVEPLTILHLDTEIVVVDKPPGLLVHRTSSGSDEPALLQRLRDQIGRRVFPVQRLDRMTSGVIAYGLDSSSAKELQAGLQAEDALKEYLVLARGPAPIAFESRLPLCDDKGIERAAWTEVVRLMTFPETRTALLRARIHTGRSHQIRRHLALASRHVAGDTRYGKARENRFLARYHGLPRIFLHAWRLDVAHPSGGRLCVRAPLARDLRMFLAGFPGAERIALAEL